MKVPEGRSVSTGGPSGPIELTLMHYQRQIQAVRKRGRRNAHRYPTAKDKTARAFAAYVDLCEAAEYLTEQMRGQLATR